MSQNFLAKGMRGFPEWLPAAKRIERDVFATIAEVYESYGYTPLETGAFEKVSTLATTGDVSKEIFGIHRLADPEASVKKQEFGLHFDLTLPFARYTAENAGALQFPFKRYQMQKVWRGEKAQAGRYREFYQADIDIVGDGDLPLHYEAEVVDVIYTIFTKLNVGDFTIRINNRKLLEGVYTQAGIDDMNATLIAVDKIDKIGVEKVQELLRTNGLSQEQAEVCTDLASKKFTVAESFAFLDSLEATSDMLIQAKEELTSIFKNLSHLPDGAVIFDLSIARGLDYYTGSVYECTLSGLEKYGSVCSGGRYDDLTKKFSKRSLPGVGLSIGISRLLYILFDEGRLKLEAATPTEAVVILFDEEQRPNANKIARDLRDSGIKVEVSPAVKKIGKQFQFAEKRGAKFVVIPEANGDVQMKNLELGEQSALDIAVMKSALAK